MNDHVPDFSKIAPDYASFRPRYPRELFAWLADAAPGRAVAWDTATGSGQAALGLAEDFDRVIATDVSTEQLRHATPHPRVEYRTGAAEDSGLEAGTVDLAVAAAAAHWFDLPRFGAEVRRVLRPGGVVAVWTYHVAHVSAPLDDILGPFFRDLIAPYFAARAQLVNDRYVNLRLPGTDLAVPEFRATVSWTAAQAEGFVRTWSGVHAYVAATGRDPVPDLVPALEAAFGDASREASFPLYVRAARL